MDKNRYLSDFSQVDWVDRTWKILHFIKTPPIELVHGIRTKSLPLAPVLGASILATVPIVTHLDAKLFSALGIQAVYPWVATSPGFWIYSSLALSSGFWLWALQQTFLKQKLQQRLTDVFLSAGLDRKSTRLNSSH